MIKKWLAEAIPTGDALQLDAALAAMDAGHAQQAKDILTGLVAADPANMPARLHLAKVTVLDDIPAAVDLISSIEVTEPEHFSTKESIETLGRLYALHQDPTGLADEEGKDMYIKAISALAKYDWDQALELFINVIQSNRYYDDDGARKAGIAIFNALGSAHELTRKHRRMFDMMLY